MRTALFSPCYLDGNDPQGSPRLERNLRYLDWYLGLKERLGFERIVLADNHSSLEEIAKLPVREDVVIHRFDEFLPRGEGPYNYPYCWRALYFMRELIAQGFEKILLIDTDCFIVSRKLLTYTRFQAEGWSTVWCERWKFPEAAFQVLCKDAFPLFLDYTSGHYLEHNNQCMEKVLPFTHVEMGFVSSRFGETSSPQTPEMDLYAQARLDIPLSLQERD